MRSHQVSVGGIGVRLAIRLVDDAYVPADLATLAYAILYLGKPDGTTTTHDLTAALPLSDGIVYYDTTSADLTMAGTFTLQPWLMWEDGDQYYSEAIPFVVSLPGTLE